MDLADILMVVSIQDATSLIHEIECIMDISKSCISSKKIKWCVFLNQPYEQYKEQNISLLASVYAQVSERHVYGTDKKHKYKYWRHKKLQWLSATHTLQNVLEFYGKLCFKVLTNSALKSSPL